MTDQLRIAYLGDGSSPHLQRLAYHLARRGHPITIITAKKHGPFPDIPGVIFETYDSSFFAIKKVAQIRAILRKIKPHVLHSHFVNYGGFIGMTTGFHPHIISAWGCDVLNVPKESFLSKLKVVLAIRTSDGMLPVSNQLRDEIHQGFSRSLKLNKVLSWGIDLNHFKPTNGHAFRTKIGVKAEDFVILSPRGMSAIYNHHLVLEAWPSIKARIPNAKLLLLRFMADVEYVNRIQTLISSQDYQRDILWIDPLSYEELPEAYCGSDIVLSVAKSDGTPQSVLEAMACGRCVVVSDIAPLRDWVTDLRTGRLVPLKSGPIAQTLVDLFKTPNDRQDMGVRARKFIIEHADHQSSLDTLEKIYRDLALAPGRFNWVRSLSNFF